MAGVTDWVRRALAELGPDATTREVTDYILGKDPTVPKSYISLAMRNIRLAAARKQAESRPPDAKPSQGPRDSQE